MFKHIVTVFIFIILNNTAANALEVRNTFETYGYISHSEVLESALNPGNNIFSLPVQGAVLDFRDNFEVLTEKTKWVFRPRWSLNEKQLQKENPSSDNISLKGKLDISAGYLDWDISDQWKAVVGLQVYQWGPGEFMSPSNVFFKFSSDQKSFFYLRKGQVLTRLNWTPTSQLNFVFIAEPISNNESPSLGENKFEEKTIVKGEYRFKNGSQVSGLFGSEGGDKVFGGEYFAWYLTDSTSFYGDLHHIVRSSWYDPVYDGSGFIQLLETNTGANQIFTSANWGLRWEGAVDLRAEWFYNGLAWGADGLKAAIESLKLPNPHWVQNASIFNHSGHELPGQGYFYISARIPDLGKRKDASLYIRNVLSLQDSSGSITVSGDKVMGDSWTGYFEVSQSYGASLSEMRLLYGTQISVGARLAL